MPDPYELPDGTMSWNKRFGSYEQLSAQITRWFRHWSVYVGGENLTGFTQKTSIYGADNPWGTSFEPTLVWARARPHVLCRSEDKHRKDVVSRTKYRQIIIQK